MENKFKRNDMVLYKGNLRLINIVSDDGAMAVIDTYVWMDMDNSIKYGRMVKTEKLTMFKKS